jgi:predicted ABC-type ATPase
MFAGPNGSGKSVLKSYLPPMLLGVYLNPDEIEQCIRTQGYLDLNTFGVKTSAEEVLSHFRESAFLSSVGLAGDTKRLEFREGRLDFGDVAINSYLSYLASVTVDFLRQKLIECQDSLTLETVMSHPSKIDLLALAQAAGYRTYLYFVATDDPAINISRVRNRIALGGHAVPAQKIEARYRRSLSLLIDAIRFTNRAYIFDNSTENADHQHTWIAEITGGRTLDLKANHMPSWFKLAVLDKIK